MGVYISGDIKGELSKVRLASRAILLVLNYVKFFVVAKLKIKSPYSGSR